MFFVYLFVCLFVFCVLVEMGLPVPLNHTQKSTSERKMTMVMNMSMMMKVMTGMLMKVTLMTKMLMPDTTQMVTMMIGDQTFLMRNPSMIGLKNIMMMMTTGAAAMITVADLSALMRTVPRGELRGELTIGTVIKRLFTVSKPMLCSTARDTDTDMGLSKELKFCHVTESTSGGNNKRLDFYDESDEKNVDNDVNDVNYVNDVNDDANDDDEDKNARDASVCSFSEMETCMCEIIEDCEKMRAIDDVFGGCLKSVGRGSENGEDVTMITKGSSVGGTCCFECGVDLLREECTCVERMTM